ncbi:metallophosphoesterase [Dysgonomonas sp. Marseille-P4677]|uniref:metallophosphoesterase n=1 Tax=Dysgonomonas sp. Marseille-P4677 TaxID=2364790 RepID=UPI0019114C36|nr:metallophosphoesterase [Dysgonomonas sp. Marseille-P4677]MBK5722320.1 metallophosphoesterase [Dysgonomonas sp. Marseille-P4677]
MKEIDKAAEKIFFTSDIHFGHKWLLDFNKRPFNSVEDMDNTLIKNWNDTVATDALVFVLGDIGETDDDRILEIFNQLSGIKILIRGNHDITFKQETLQQIFLEIYDLLEIKILDTLEFQEVVLCHYPMFDWNNFHEGAWQLFGHIHTRELPEFETLNSKLFAQQYDVGVDGSKFRPISFYEVKEIIEKQKETSYFKNSNYY